MYIRLQEFPYHAGDRCNKKYYWKEGMVTTNVQPLPGEV